ncbi:Uncharacterised protein [Mycobacteroides abscessus subsp. abscessus]|nr:Uncharacterised protein [Mycobacteroides abscessus subsp. abscessus]
MITARELADQCNVPVGTILIALADIRELALGPDSGVRDEAADLIRARIRDAQNEPSAGAPQARSADEQLHTLREKLSGTAGAPLINLNARRSRTALKKLRGWRPGDDPLNPIVKALADQIVEYSRDWNRPPGVIFPDELTEARTRHEAWVRACIEQGTLLSDDAILAWITAFPRRVLQPDTIVTLAAQGLTAESAKLRLWYGRINNGRRQLLDQIQIGDITVENALADIEKFKGRQAN